jgi:hypothetical protein
MIPIYEQGSGKGIGHNLKSFRARFDEICSEHLAQGRAKSFAFIFYDFTDRALSKILDDEGAFTQLDRLAGTELSVFFLHTGTAAAIESFNQHFLNALGVKEPVALPCVVFFRIAEAKIVDIEIAQLEHADLIHGFRELHDVIARYIKTQSTAPERGETMTRWLKPGGKFIGLEVFRALLRSGLDWF